MVSKSLLGYKLISSFLFLCLWIYRITSSGMPTRLAYVFNVLEDIGQVNCLTVYPECHSGSTSAFVLTILSVTRAHVILNCLIYASTRYACVMWWPQFIFICFRVWLFSRLRYNFIYNIVFIGNLHNKFCGLWRRYHYIYQQIHKRRSYRETQISLLLRLQKNSFCIPYTGRNSIPPVRNYWKHVV